MSLHLELTIEAIILTLVISGLPLALSAVVGLLVSVLQAATSVQDQTICYVSKLATLLVTLFFCGKWFSHQIIDLTRRCLWALANAG